MTEEKHFPPNSDGKGFFNPTPNCSITLQPSYCPNALTQNFPQNKFIVYLMFVNG